MFLVAFVHQEFLLSYVDFIGCYGAILRFPIVKVTYNRYFPINRINIISKLFQSSDLSDFLFYERYILSLHWIIKSPKFNVSSFLFKV